MTPKQLLQSVINGVELEPANRDKEIHISAKSDAKSGKMTISTEIEGKFEVVEVEVQVRRLGVFDSLSA